MRIAYIEKTWGECYRNGRKVEDYSWEVTFFESFPDQRTDRHCYKTEEFALKYAKMFKEGQYTLGEHREVLFPETVEI